MLRRFLVLIVLASVLFVLANTIAHASPADHSIEPYSFDLNPAQYALPSACAVNIPSIEYFPSNALKH